MTAYKFTSHRQLRQMLNDVEVVQKKDISTYAGGHLNESLLFKPPTTWASQNWVKVPSPPPKSEKKTPSVSKPKSSENDTKMRDVLYDFSVGTAGSIPSNKDQNKTKTPRRYPDSRPRSRKKCVSVSSEHSLYSELEKDGVLVEELKAEEMMLPSPRVPGMAKKLPPMDDEGGYNIMEDLTKSIAEEGLLSFRHTFLPTYHVGVTKRDQYSKLKNFESEVLKKKESSEKNVLSGDRAVKHLEDRLQSELESMNFTDIGPNFHKLQIYSNVFEDLIESSPTFVYILRYIKTEYDNYISTLLDTQTTPHSRLLREQVEQMTSRGTSRPQDLTDAKNRVANLEQKARDILLENEKLRKTVEAEQAWFKPVVPEKELQQKKFKGFKEEGPAELAEEIEHVKALILEKLDDLSNLRTKLRDEFVPLTVCTHLEQCIKETEVEVQKLLKQNEYFERSISEMEADLKEAIQQADTSERDAKRIWRKVNSRKGLPHIPNLHNGGSHESDDDEDDESKWNWYIS